MNGSSKVRVSYSKYKMIPEDIIWDDSDDEEDFEYFNQVSKVTKANEPPMTLNLYFPR